MSRSFLTLLFCLTIFSATIPGCVRRQEEQAAFTKDAPSELAADVAEAEVLVLDTAVVAEPERPAGLEIYSRIGSRIQWVVEHGASVKKGDELVRLDSAELEKAVAGITAESHMARAALVRAEATVAAAEIALAEFTEGLFPLEEEEVQVQLLEAELKLRHAGENKAQAELATAHVKLAKRRLDVLRKFTKPKRTEELKGAVSAARAELQARTELVQLTVSRRDRMLEQLKSCSIKAPESGQVFLADENGIRAGAVVRKGQVLIYLQGKN